MPMTKYDVSPPTVRTSTTTETVTAGGVTTTTTTTKSEPRVVVNFEWVETIKGPPDDVFAYYGSESGWTGVEGTIWEALIGTGIAIAVKETPPLPDSPKGKWRYAQMQEGAELYEVMLSSDPKARVFKYQLIGSDNPHTDGERNAITAMFGVKYDRLNVTFSVASAEDGASIVTWCGDCGTTDADGLKKAGETFYGLFTQLFAAKFAA
mmetsp:Transcript_4132/g.10437  ORF Transcript_4132/g.10437 Transcript_4132/m.10437 type:complete len:208 (-) Transcript_4132:145-768(-)|eukprot:CAMPEP_0182931642 /NCGR_PEP_ID=MMETSP0105_2-20130417/29010_1 /TAXON_ID=81532 ORGANISM="Acanthoeca-like sp., Strain 10tr" /NCGR_SAMPLE_ID=MMETSP0105_2 /ASSEMBLY_ACC=CAM_ASM_000205 /LENGTH=207 /DNA_ID=CAMNT_0025070115 /DNA_START=41 /DNA_END=664 /DNA_ORIENTATION=-